MSERQIVDEVLLKQLKADNDIPEGDASMDEKITLLAENGIVELDYQNGKANEYTVAGKARSLLFGYVKYALANALDDFWKNYQSDVVAFINASLSEAYASSQEEDQ